MNNLFLEDFEKYCELWKKEYNSGSFGSTAIFKPYYSFEDRDEFNKVLENCKKFLQKLDSKYCLDYFLTLRGSVQFECDFDLSNDIVKYIEIEIFVDKIIAGYTFWDDSLRDSEKNYEMRMNWEKIERDIDNLEEDNGFQDVCGWVESKLNECKKETE